MTAVREPVARPEVRARRRQPWLSKRRLPYLLIAPAILFELLIHVIPLLSGVGISFLGLTQFFIRNWTQAPFVGLGNYRRALDFGGPIGEGLLHSFLITAAFTVIVVALAWGDRACSPRSSSTPSSAASAGSARCSWSRTRCRSTSP